MAAIIEQFASIDHPALAIEMLELSGDANGDGRPDPGETIDLALTLVNPGIAVDGTSISATLTCSDPGITVLNDMVTFADCPAGGTTTGDAMFSFSVAEGTDPFFATFSFEMSADYEGASEPFISMEDQMVRIGRPATLVVDSDGPDDDNETFLTSELASRGIGYDVWATPTTGEIDGDELMRYDRVYWLGGTNPNDLMATEAFGLAAFLDNGGELIMSSQYATDNSENSQFIEDYFGVQLEQDLGVTTFLLEGVEGDPYFGNTNFVITGSGGASNNEHPDRLMVTGDHATGFTTWLQGGGTGGVYVETDDYKAIFMGFPVEAARTHSSYPNSLTMDTFLDRAENFFSGNTSVGEPALASEFRIEGAWPNPFNPSTMLSFTLPQASNVNFTVYNTLGRKVANIEGGALPAGTHEVTVDGSALASGLYFIQMSADEQVRDLIKVSLVK